MRKDNKENSPGRGLTVIATRVHGLLRPPSNHNHKLVASGSTKYPLDCGDINISPTWKSRDCQLGEKFRNLAPKSCRLGSHTIVINHHF